MVSPLRLPSFSTFHRFFVCAAACAGTEVVALCFRISSRKRMNLSYNMPHCLKISSTLRTRFSFCHSSRTILKVATSVEGVIRITFLFHRAVEDVRVFVQRQRKGGFEMHEHEHEVRRIEACRGVGSCGRTIHRYDRVILRTSCRRWPFFSSGSVALK